MLVDSLIAKLAAADGADREWAKDRLIGLAIDQFRTIAHRMLTGFPAVRRWEQTDDILQGAAIRLARALEEVRLQDARHLFHLMAMQVRRELLDLTKRYAAQHSFARQHETNALPGRSELVKVDIAPDPEQTTSDQLSSWTDFHAAASTLEEHERELFHLVWYLGMNQEEAASVIGCSVRSVARRWELTKKHLLRRLGGQAPI